MKKNKEIIVEIYKNHKSLLVMMIGSGVVMVIGMFLMFLKLKPSGSVVKVLYSDLLGYKDGSWRELLVFPMGIFVLTLSLQFLTMRLYEKKGVIPAKTAMVVGYFLYFLMILVYFRLVGER